MLTAARRPALVDGWAWLELPAEGARWSVAPGMRTIEAVIDEDLRAQTTLTLEPSACRRVLLDLNAGRLSLRQAPCPK